MQHFANTAAARSRTAQIPSGHLTLLLVGELDNPLIRINEEAYSQMFCERELKIIPAQRTCLKNPGHWQRWPAGLRRVFNSIWYEVNV